MSYLLPGRGERTKILGPEREAAAGAGGGATAAGGAGGGKNAGGGGRSSTGSMININFFFDDVSEEKIATPSRQ